MLFIQHVDMMIVNNLIIDDNNNMTEYRKLEQKVLSAKYCKATGVIYNRLKIITQEKVGESLYARYGPLKSNYLIKRKFLDNKGVSLVISYLLLERQEYVCLQIHF